MTLATLATGVPIEALEKAGNLRFVSSKDLDVVAMVRVVDGSRTLYLAGDDISAQSLRDAYAIAERRFAETGNAAVVVLHSEIAN